MVSISSRILLGECLWLGLRKKPNLAFEHNKGDSNCVMWAWLKSENHEEQRAYTLVQSLEEDLCNEQHNNLRLSWIVHTHKR